MQNLSIKILCNRKICSKKYFNSMINALLNSIVRFDACLSLNAFLLFLGVIYHFHFFYSLSSMAPHSQPVAIAQAIVSCMKSSCQFCQQHIPEVNDLYNHSIYIYY